ncbi:MAG: tripartite tricarboxylate transporter substrate binding protein [Pseudomonadota bacterium]
MQITRRRILGAALAAPVIGAMPKFASAARWPGDGPIRLVVASGAGGNADVVARLVAEELEKTLEQSIVVENLSSASGMQGTEAVSNADADGYTLLVGTSSQLVHNIALFDPLPVDITRTLTGVAMMNEVPMVLLVNNDSPANSVEELIAQLKADPDAAQFGSGPAGTTTHITGALFRSKLGLDVTHVPYPKSGEALRDLIAGRLTFQFIPALSAIGQIRDGAVKPLGVAAPSRLGAAPDIPTISEAGLPGFVSQTWNSIAAPTGTPAAIVTRLNDEVNAIVQSDAFKTKLTDLGSIVPGPMSPEEVNAYYAVQRDTWIPVVRDTGVRRSTG